MIDLPSRVELGEQEREIGRQTDLPSCPELPELAFCRSSLIVGNSALMQAFGLRILAVDFSPEGHGLNWWCGTFSAAIFLKSTVRLPRHHWV